MELHRVVVAHNLYENEELITMETFRVYDVILPGRWKISMEKFTVCDVMLLTLGI